MAIKYISRESVRDMYGIKEEIYAASPNRVCTHSQMHFLMSSIYSDLSSATNNVFCQNGSSLKINFSMCQIILHLIYNRASEGENQSADRFLHV
jgi:hypothetical protein